MAPRVKLEVVKLEVVKFLKKVSVLSFLREVKYIYI
jgi:hypothetical protein